jgi:hypothetical protein
VSEYLFDNPYLGLHFGGDSNADEHTTGAEDLGDPPDMTIQPIKLGKVYHVPHGVPYHRENSRRGCVYAAHHGYDSIDLDMQIDRQLVMWNSHWERPLDKDGFTDPAGKVPPKRMFKNMTTDTVQRLVAHDNGLTYHIDTMGVRFRDCKELGLKVRAEAKPDDRWTVEQFKELMRQAVAAGMHGRVVIATQPNDPAWRDRLRNARHAGFDTRKLG